MKRKRPPMQPIVIDDQGVVRFQQNVLVRRLLDEGRKHGLDLNWLALVDAPRSDHEQFAQLIGYSVSGFGDLPYVRPETIERADALAERLRPDEI